MPRPRPLHPGAAIGVVAPASAPREAGQLEAGLERLRAIGFRVETGRPDYSPLGYLSGSDSERLAELNGMFRRTDIDAIFCVRGGYGSLRLLPDLDYDAARENPKLLVGYSDITALQLALYTKSGVPGVAGAMVASDFRDPDPASVEFLWRVLSGDAPLSLGGMIGGELETVRPGRAEGILIGGNLTLITRLIGTAYLPPLEGSILFFEEIGEEPYRLDGLLAHLRLSGILDAVSGVVVGAITEWQPKHERPSLSVDEVLAHYLDGLACPVVRGLAFGHIREKVAVPLGVRARLVADPDVASLTVLEPVVAAGETAG